jgi:hypothetical protein
MKWTKRNAQAYNGLTVSHVNPPTRVALRGDDGIMVMKRHARDFGDCGARAEFDLGAIEIPAPQKAPDHLKARRSAYRPQSLDRGK